MSHRRCRNLPPLHVHVGPRRCAVQSEGGRKGGRKGGREGLPRCKGTTCTTERNALTHAPHPLHTLPALRRDLGLHSRMVRWFDSRDVVAFIPIIDGLLWGDDYVHAGLPYDITTCRCACGA